MKKTKQSVIQRLSQQSTNLANSLVPPYFKGSGPNSFLGRNGLLPRASMSNSKRAAEPNHSWDDRPVYSGQHVELGPIALATEPRAVGVLRRRKPAEHFTPELLAQSWHYVKRAKGGPGVDGVSLATFEENLAEELDTLRNELAAGHYKPKPVRQVFVPKANQGLRPIAIWAIRDRIAQRAVYEIIAPTFEEIFLPCSYGFRPERSVNHAVEEVQRHLSKNRQWVVDADIQSCFDEIDIRILMRLIQKRVKDRLLLHYLRGWLHAGILSGMDGKPKRAGASQGSVLSPLFANIYLHEMDKTLRHKQLALVRYADDFVICCQRKQQAEEALAIAQKTLKQLRLQLNPQKTQIVHRNNGFAWLGHFFVGNSCYRI